jgi:hypothetical protein
MITSLVYGIAFLRIYERDRSLFQPTAHQNQTSDVERPDNGLAGTRDFGLKIRTFPQKPG